MILRNAPLTSDSYMYLERYVNCGSPSGFTDKYTTSPGTRPKDPNESFYLCAPEFPGTFTIQDFGNQPDFFRKWQLLVHPDMINDCFFSSCTKIEHNAVLVSPTSSARTVKIVGDDGWFLKLHYKDLVGRYARQIGMNQAQSSIEASSVISTAIEKKLLPRNFYFLRETFARIMRLLDGTSTNDWGIILREPIPHPYSPRAALLLPAFSLFSSDIKHPDDPSILVQLVSNQSKAVEDFLFDDLLAPIFDAYFNLLLRCGLELEANAQNMLFTIDRNLQVVGVVARDGEAVGKDFSLMKALALPNPFQRMPWKCLMRGQYNYCIMHSFMFDFKLGEYLVSPIIAEAVRHFSFDQNHLIERIRSHNRRYLAQLPQDFFPADGKWYSYPRIVIDRTKKRPYIAQLNPRYR